MIARALVFLAVFGALQLAWQQVDGGALYQVVIDQGVVAPAAALANALTPGWGIHAAGNSLREPSGGLNIVNGCDGMETLFLLLAGFAVAPLSCRSRLCGVLIGIVVVYGLNLMRILALFYARHSDMKLFDLLHGVITPAIMVLAIAAFYYVWLRRSDGPTAH